MRAAVPSGTGASTAAYARASQSSAWWRWLRSDKGLTAATLPQPPVAPYVHYFSYREGGICAESCGPSEVG
jgi:hypothetical protein